MRLILLIWINDYVSRAVYKRQPGHMRSAGHKLSMTDTDNFLKVKLVA